MMIIIINLKQKMKPALIIQPHLKVRAKEKDKRNISLGKNNEI